METASEWLRTMMVTCSHSTDAGPGIADCEVLVTDPHTFFHNIHHLLAGSRLRWVQLTYAGVDPIMAALSSLGKVC